jgi:membrane-bound metal-dependent hydrolase YbcI (DUF457 family)
MASPIGHALVGIGLAALAVPLAGVSPTPALWLGAVVASGLPDLDFVGTAFGLAPDRTHRGPSHSLLALAILALAALGLSWRFASTIPFEWVLVWSFALLAHPVVDLLATGPKDARDGFGLPLLWPIVSRRWYLSRPPVQPASLEQYGTSDIWRLLLPELFTFGSACIGLVLLGRAL